MRLPRFVIVARREYKERVRTKAFVIATFAGPILMAGLMLGPALVAGAVTVMAIAAVMGVEVG